MTVGAFEDHVRAHAEWVAGVAPDARAEVFEMAEATIRDAHDVREGRLTPGVHANRAKARATRRRELIRTACTDLED